MRGIDIAGHVFGNLKAIKRLDKKATDGSFLWKCKCDCGKIIEVTPARLRAKNKPTTSCGCMKSQNIRLAAQNREFLPFQNLTGKRFGKLKVIKYKNKVLNNCGAWQCRCDCGNTVLARTSALNSGGISSCGCKQKCASGLAKTREHSSWYSAKYRCRNPKHKQYYAYGGRGIKFSKRWDNIDNFIADMGKCPDGMMLERIDPDGDYCKDNCVWTTWKLQCINRRKTPIEKLKSVVKSEYKSGNISLLTYKKYMKYIKRTS